MLSPRVSPRHPQVAELTPRIGRDRSVRRPSARIERLTEPDRLICQSFKHELYRHIDPEIDVPAGDANVGTPARHRRRLDRGLTGSP